VASLPAAVPEVRALTRGLRLLEILAAEPAGLALTEITQLAQLSKSSAHRLLQTLIHNGYVSQESSSGRYRPSLKLLQLGSQLAEQASLASLAHPHLSQIAEFTGETVHLVVLEGDDAVYVAKVESPSPIRMYSKIGMRVPLHCTGVGKAILAHLPEDRLLQLADNGRLQRFTDNTITDPAALRRHLADVRRRGYAIDNGEHEEPVRCIAAPLFARDRRVVGAMSIAAVSYRVDLKTLRGWWPLLRSHAEQLNAKLVPYFDRYI